MKTSEIRVGEEYVWLVQPDNGLGRASDRARRVHVRVSEVKAHRVTTKRVQDGTADDRYGRPKPRYRNRPHVRHDAVRIVVMEALPTGLGFSDTRIGEEHVVLPRDIEKTWAAHIAAIEAERREDEANAARMAAEDAADAEDFARREAARADVLVPVRAVLAEAGIPDSVITDLADPDWPTVEVPVEALLKLASKARDAQ